MDFYLAIKNKNHIIVLPPHSIKDSIGHHHICIILKLTIVSPSTTLNITCADIRPNLIKQIKLFA